MKGVYAFFLTTIAVIACVRSVSAQDVYLGAGQQVYIGNEVTVLSNLTNAGAVNITGGGLHFSGNEYKNITRACYNGRGYVNFYISAAGSKVWYWSSTSGTAGRGIVMDIVSGTPDPNYAMSIPCIK